jgi:polar amino acid transport system substrate-binding protein
MGALEQYELDMVVGGLTDDTPWKDRVALSHPYYEEDITIGSARSGFLPQAIDENQIAVVCGQIEAALVRQRGGVAVPVDDLAESALPIAAPRWRIDQLGRRPSHLRLQIRRYVLAVPPGENGWLVYLERFVRREKPSIGHLLMDIPSASSPSTAPPKDRTALSDALHASL